jgi:hypothetical protein
LLLVDRLAGKGLVGDRSQFSPSLHCRYQRLDFAYLVGLKALQDIQRCRFQTLDVEANGGCTQTGLGTERLLLRLLPICSALRAFASAV